MQTSLDGTSGDGERSDRELLLDRLAGEECEFCDGGTLVRDTYKDNVALVCDDCGSPTAQFW